MTRGASLGLLFLVIFLATHGVAYSIPMGDSDIALGQPVTHANLMFADLDGDQFITGADFIYFRGCYLGVGPDCSASDFDGDQDIDLIDFGFFREAYMGNPHHTVIPEPSTIVLVAAGCVFLAAKNRKWKSKTTTIFTSLA